MNILLTGASGFIGSHLYIQLRDAGHRVRAAVRYPEQFRVKFPGAEAISTDYSQDHNINDWQILSRDRLLGEQTIPYDRSIDSRMSRLRKKLETDPKDPRIIKTVYGAGYMLTAAVSWIEPS